MKNYDNDTTKNHQKLLEGSPLEGRNKLMVIAIFCVSAIVTALIFSIITGNTAIFEGDKDTVDTKIAEDAAKVIDNIDPNADDDTANATLAHFDEKIANATSEANRIFLMESKVNALLMYGRQAEADALMREIAAAERKNTGNPKNEWRSNSNQNNGDRDEDDRLQQSDPKAPPNSPSSVSPPPGIGGVE